MEKVPTYVGAAVAFGPQISTVLRPRMLNLDNSLLRGWMCNRQVVFVAMGPLS